jgi:hypothetical protein
LGGRINDLILKAGKRVVGEGGQLGGEKAGDLGVSGVASVKGKSLSWKS